MKRQCVRRLFEKAMSLPKRLFLHWSILTKNNKQVNACKLVQIYNYHQTVNLFTSLQNVLQASVASFLVRDRNQEIKIKTIDTIMANQVNNLHNAFSTWKNHCESIAMAEALNEEKKKFLLNNLLGFTKGSRNNLIRQVLEKFANYAKYHKVLIIVYYYRRYELSI